MREIIKRACINSVGTFAYIVLVVFLIFSMRIFSEQKDTILIPIAMLLLFVCSVAITGFLVFGKPVMLYMDGKKKDAVSLLVYTLGILALITIMVFIFLIASFKLFS